MNGLEWAYECSDKIQMDETVHTELLLERGGAPGRVLQVSSFKLSSPSPIPSPVPQSQAKSPKRRNKRFWTWADSKITILPYPLALTPYPLVPPHNSCHRLWL